MTTTTTAAIETPPGAGGIAVITLAGPQAESILASIFEPLTGHRRPGPDTLQLGRIAADGQMIDQAVVARAGEAVEINIHGGPAVVRTVMTLLAEHGAAPVSAVAQDAAAVPAAHRQWNNPAVGRELLAVMPQAKSRQVATLLAMQWSAGISQLVREAIDHPSENHSEALRKSARGFATVQRLLNPPQVVLVGPPNVGKSTLANLLIARAVSIVHDQPGTTRDWVCEPALIDGVPIELTDTAGLWEAPATDVDAEAVARARTVAAQADLAVLLADRPIPIPDFLQGKVLLTVATKSDRPGDHAWAAQAVSAITGCGIAELRTAILDKLGLAGLDTSAPAAFTARQADLLLRAADALDCSDPAWVESLTRLLEGSLPPA